LLLLGPYHGIGKVIIFLGGPVDMIVVVVIRSTGPAVAVSGMYGMCGMMVATGNRRRQRRHHRRADRGRVVIVVVVPELPLLCKGASDSAAAAAGTRSCRRDARRHCFISSSSV